MIYSVWAVAKYLLLSAQSSVILRYNSDIWMLLKCKNLIILI